MDPHLHELAQREQRRAVAPPPCNDTLDLFAPAPPARPTPPAPADHARLAAESDLGEKLLATLIPIARRMLRAAGADGVTVGEVRLQAAREGLLANDGTESLDALGALFRRIPEARATDRTRRAPSALGVSHGNRQVVWVWRGA
jgi:hypothetical protein